MRWICLTLCVLFISIASYSIVDRVTPDKPQQPFFPKWFASKSDEEKHNHEFGKWEMLSDAEGRLRRQQRSCTNCGWTVDTLVPSVPFSDAVKSSSLPAPLPPRVVP